MLTIDIYYLDLASTTVFAFGGATIARQKGANLLDICFYGLLTALGGGTLRQWILQADSVFWAEDYLYLLACIAGIAASSLFSSRCSTEKLFFRAMESCSMAVFICIGFAVTSSGTDSLSVALLLGILTGIGGGLIRDALLVRIPTSFSDPLMPILLMASFCGFYVAEAAGWASWVGACTGVTLIEINRGYIIEQLFYRRFTKSG